MGFVLGKVGEDVPMLLTLLLKLVGEVAVLVLSAVTVLFGVGLASPALPVVLDGVELPHIIMFLKLKSKNMSPHSSSSSTFSSLLGALIRKDHWCCDTIIFFLCS